MTQGFEVRQTATFAKTLERRLIERGIDAQVLNTGISGFGTAEELMFLEHEGMKYRPDAVVLAFFANDFEDNIKSNLYALEKEQLVIRKTEHIPGVRAIAIMNAIPGALWLSQNSYFFSLFVNIVWEISKKALYTGAREELITEYAINVSEADQYEQNLAVALLERMKGVAHSAGIPLVVVEIPRFDPNGITAWLPSVPRPLVPSIMAACDFYLPASAYLASGPEGRVHVPHGHHHISEQTHAKIAEALDRVLSDLDVARTSTVNQ